MEKYLKIQIHFLRARKKDEFGAKRQQINNWYTRAIVVMRLDSYAQPDYVGHVDRSEKFVFYFKDDLKICWKGLRRGEKNLEKKQ